METKLLPATFSTALVPYNQAVEPVQPEPEPVHPWGIKLPTPVLERNFTVNRITRDIIPHEDSFAVIDQDTNAVFARHVTHQYQLIPYEDSLSLVADSLVKAGLPFHLDIQLLADGGQMVATFTTQIAEPVAVDDLVSLQFVLKRSYNTIWRFILGIRGKRLVCTNGMTVGKELDSFAHKHTQKLTTGLILDEIHHGVQTFHREIDVWQGWKNRLVGVDDFERINEKVGLGKGYTEAVFDLVEKSSGVRLADAFNGAGIRTLTMWHLYNIITQFITHEVESYAQQNKFMHGLSEAMRPYRLAA